MTATGKDIANAPEVKILLDRIESLQRENEELRKDRYDLAYAITGGEDAPGLLDSTPTSEIVEIARHAHRSHSADIDRAEAAEAEVRQLISKRESSNGSSAAILDVIAERIRQQEKEGWSPEHDDEHTDGSLALAAGSYCESAARPKILARKSAGAFAIPKLWPQSWSRDWWKPKSPREDLVRAAALIIAEIERIDRAAKKD